MRRLLLSLLIVAAAGFAAGDEDAVRNAEKAWAAAVIANDAKALEDLLAPGMIYTHSSGLVETREEYAGKIAQHSYNYKGIDEDSVTVKVYGDAAMLHSKARLRGTSANGPFDVNVIMLHMWVKQGGKWKLAAHQATKQP